MLGACATASSATVYKWVDDNGVTHYSDQPNPKAQKLQVPDAQTYGAKQAAVTAPPAANSAPPTAAPAVCVIDSPGSGQVFLDTYAISGHVTLAHVGADSQTTLRLDGQDISSQLRPDGAFTIPQIDRGDHTLSLQVNSAQGGTACQGNSITFSIRQRSAAGPNAVPMAPMAPAAPRAPGVGAPH
ncbi:MAG TPA: DUF4124 domain-containing protein [Steroidobacteraceae bacterium]|nr:DUF4124 domain-containing protein [Steroidobacteraceae bacterium]